MITLAGLQKWMNRLIADVTNGLNGGKVHLYKNDHTPTKDTVASDLVEADYVGYTEQTVTTWGAPFIDVGGRLVTAAPSNQFQPTDDTVPNNIYGYWITDKAGDLVAVYRFPAGPVGLGGPLDSLLLQATVRLFAG